MPKLLHKIFHLAKVCFLSLHTASFVKLFLWCNILILYFPAALCPFPYTVQMVQPAGEAERKDGVEDGAAGTEQGGAEAVQPEKTDAVDSEVKQVSKTFYKSCNKTFCSKANHF